MKRRGFLRGMMAAAAAAAAPGRLVTPVAAPLAAVYMTTRWVDGKLLVEWHNDIEEEVDATAVWWLDGPEEIATMSHPPVVAVDAWANIRSQHGEAPSFGRIEVEVIQL